MHLAEIARLRMVPCAGLLLSLTRRCPLACAHCSTESSPESEQGEAASFLSLVGSFALEDRPEVILMSGGEPLLRPRLVRELATRAKEAGTRAYLLSGMFFARGRGTIPRAIENVLPSLDHFAASLDVFHERQVGRDAVFRAVHRIREIVPAVSFQITGEGDDDPYLEDVVEDVRREFDDRIPVLVTRLRRTGRARRIWPVRTAGPHLPAAAPLADPCALATWPLVGHDGTVYACSRESLVLTSRPSHLVLGHASRDTWSEVRRRALSRAVLTGVRTMGPVEVRRRFGAGEPAPGGRRDPCVTCAGLADDHRLAARAEDYFHSPNGTIVAALAGGAAARRDPYAFPRRWGSPRYAELVGLGWDGPGRGAECAG
ncbi:radical SAM protein [Microbispora sp. ATCC PTA-5024]|uniref:radical SAM protein n=1 Tax=Microbispora sp. ATCC PTA-5024 TaxID=316330 RepID=UPI0003DCAAA6|nr:radical SAM protein [Microbispora sp. ATCC PTA-5024]ETK37751.1 hypothetical protein MPTA5024_02125 [Microbispora sp. ATCC PTA-5024]